MCARYTFFDGKVIRDDFGDLTLPDLTPSWNIAPMDWAPVMLKQQGILHARPMRWGLIPPWAEDSIATRTINARSETVSEKPAFRSAFRSRRCLIPSNGYYEWRGAGKTKQACFIHPSKGGLISFAGLYEEKEGLETFTIITCTPNQKLLELHDRMPVVLGVDDALAWLSEAPSQDLLSLLRPCPDDWLSNHPVDNRVGRVNEEGPHLIEKVRAQSSLFD